MIIGVDFDRTCIFGKNAENIGSERVLKRLIEAGHKLILLTMREDEALQEAIDWFKDRRISLYGINENPEQRAWSNHIRPYCQLYIDDAALGCPLLYKKDGAYFVDWFTVECKLVDRGILKYEPISKLHVAE